MSFLSLAGLVQRCVIIQKDENGFGLTVSGDNPVFVQLVREGDTRLDNSHYFETITAAGKSPLPPLTSLRRRRSRGLSVCLSSYIWAALSDGVFQTEALDWIYVVTQCVANCEGRCVLLLGHREKTVIAVFVWLLLLSEWTLKEAHTVPSG